MSQVIPMPKAFDPEVVENALARAASNEAKALRKLQEHKDATRSWHLVQINQQSFKLAEQQLKWAGYGLYAPQVREMVKPKSRELSLGQRANRHLIARERLSPYFGSYRFVRFHAAADPWHDLFKLVGVHGIGCKGNMPVPMPDALIDELKADEQNGAIPADVPVMALYYKVGDAARVNEGPFMGFTGKVDRVDERGRITLLLNLFSALTPTDFMADDIQKVETAPPAKSSHT
jgi:transcription antitermination factor NusG